MCGIWGALYQKTSHITYEELLQSINSIKHRGPDQTQTGSIELSKYNFTYGFHRLAIIDRSELGMQPMFLNDAYLLCNGEIFNYKHLKEKYQFNTKSESDCEVLLHMYDKFGRGLLAIERICKEIDAEFAFMIFDLKDESLYMGRDFGIRGYMYLQRPDGLFLSSEMKGLQALTDNGKYKIEHFPPLSYAIFNTVGLEFYKYKILEPKVYLTDRDLIKEQIRLTLTKSVHDRLQSDRPIGFFLSGGLDSSLIVAIASKLLSKENIRTFSIGMENSPDLIAARKVSSFLGTQHKEIIFDFETGFNNIDNVIHSLGTYDTTTIRASCPQYILSKYIVENTDIRVLLSGEGSDELAFGYLMFKHAPTPDDAQKCSIDLCNELYMYDCLRVDRSTAAHGLEVRVPFLSQDYINLILSIHPSLKMPLESSEQNFNESSQYNMELSPQQVIEKCIIRESFEGYLPDDILWRGKAAFSDAVGLSWVDLIKNHTNKLNLSSSIKIGILPRSSEEIYYRQIFDKYYPGQEHILKHFWEHKWQTISDPSARYIGGYKEH